MKGQGCTRSLIIYEIKNVAGNPFTLFFSIVFPIVMLYLFNNAFIGQIPEPARGEAANQMFLTMSIVIPLAALLIGHGANYSQELEKEVPLRMNLFGFSPMGMMIAKLVANFAYLTAALAIYIITASLLIDILIPQFQSALIFTIAIYLLAAIFFIMSHAIATLFRKFGPTYGITMMLYFLFMILSGMMGVPYEMLPETIRKIAGLLPMTYISRDFGRFWQGGSYNFAPFLQAMLFLGAAAGILLFISLYKEKRKLQ